MEKSVRVILVDDEIALTKILSARLNRLGFNVTTAETGEAALHMLSEREFDVAVLDMRLPGINGLELLKQIKDMQPELEVIMLTGFGSIDTATEAMKFGAYDYLTKPCKASRLEQVINKAAEKKRLSEQARGLSEALWRQTGNRPIIGQSEKIRNLIEIIRKVADGNAPVLILGESGTGKELVARSLHFWSKRRNKPFQALNTAAIPEQLLESELFGHAKGAFSGAVNGKIGLVEDADGGTLFLDEIGELDPSMQAKLLRFLEEGEFRRVGENRTRSVQVRIIGATNRDLYDEVQKGNFRADLYYRLNVVTINVPPLRERREDIPILTEYFLKMIAGNSIRKELSRQAKEALIAYELPGNVRELKNMIERGILLAPGSKIEVEHLFCNKREIPQMFENDNLSIRGSSEEDNQDDQIKNNSNRYAGCVKDEIKENGYIPDAIDRDNLNEEELKLWKIEREHIAKVLNLVGGKKVEAAKLLGIGLRTLYRKLAEYDLENK